jgi:hypothetical protein
MPNTSNTPTFLFPFLYKLQAVTLLRRLVTGLSPRKAGFDPGLVHVGFMVDKVARG